MTILFLFVERAFLMFPSLAPCNYFAAPALSFQFFAGRPFFRLHEKMVSAGLAYHVGVAVMILAPGGFSSG